MPSKKISQLTELTTGASGDKFPVVDASTNETKWIDWDNLPAGGGGISNVVEDTTPQLGGDLDVNGNTITSATNGAVTTSPHGSGVNTVEAGSGGVVVQTTAGNSDITITPHGTGDVVIDGLKYPQADGTANQVLETDGAGQLGWVTPSAGGSDTNCYVFHYADTGTTSKYFVSDTLTEISSGQDDYRAIISMPAAGEVSRVVITGGPNSGSTYHIEVYVNGSRVHTGSAVAATKGSLTQIAITGSSWTYSASDYLAFRVSGNGTGGALPSAIGSCSMTVQVTNS